MNDLKIAYDAVSWFMKDFCCRVILHLNGPSIGIVQQVPLW